MNGPMSFGRVAGVYALIEACTFGILAIFLAFVWLIMPDGHTFNTTFFQPFINSELKAYLLVVPLSICACAVISPLYNLTLGRWVNDQSGQIKMWELFVVYIAVRLFTFLLLWIFVLVVWIMIGYAPEIFDLQFRKPFNTTVLNAYGVISIIGFIPVAVSHVIIQKIIGKTTEI